jgi:excisionase family DNA binding protein
MHDQEVSNGMTLDTTMRPPDRRRCAGSELLEVAHVAHRLRSSHEYVRELIRKRKLAAILFGRRYRIDPLDLQAFIDQHRIPAVGR